MGVRVSGRGGGGWMLNQSDDTLLITSQASGHFPLPVFLFGFNYLNYVNHSPT